LPIVSRHPPFHHAALTADDVASPVLLSTLRSRRGDAAAHAE
jgi:hypothetical protein